MSNPTPEARLRRIHDSAEFSIVGEVILGRHSDCDIVIDDEGGVSRRHARLTGSSDGVFVSDLGSLNGTLINGNEAKEPTELQHGDRLVFDEYEYEVIIPVVEEAGVDEDVTRIANREEILERLSAAANAEESSGAGSSGAGSMDAEPSAFVPRNNQVSIDNEVPIHEVRVNEITPNDVAAAEIDLPDASDIQDSTRNPSLESAPEVDDTGPEPTDDIEPKRSISASDPFDRIENDNSRSVPDSPAVPAPYPVIDEPPAPERVKAAPVPEPAEPESPVPEPPSEPAVPESPVPAESLLAAEALPELEPEPPRRPSERTPPPPPESPEKVPEKVPEESQPNTNTEFPDEADLPGAWANTAAVMNTDNRTMIAQYVVPARNAPAEVDISTITVPALVIRTGDFEGKVLTLNAPANEWLVGSGSGSDLRIKQEGISSRHAVFVREQNKLKLCDELSVNGTFINGNRINVGYIGHGDVLRFGPVECELFMPNFKGRAASGRKVSTEASNGGARRRKRKSRTWLTALLVAAVLIPIIAIAVLFLLPQ